MDSQSGFCFVLCVVGCVSVVIGEDLLVLTPSLLHHNPHCLTGKIAAALANSGLAGNIVPFTVTVAKSVTVVVSVSIVTA